MNKNYFEIKRAGINTTFQDQGTDNLYHIGIPFSGAMDNRNFQISNKLVGNEVNFPTIEFAYQGPLFKYFGEKINFAITGDVKFIIRKIRKKNNTIEGKCYQSFALENGDELDIISTNKSVYGYLAVSGEFDVNYQWSSCSVNTKANIGANNGKKIDFILQELFRESNTLLVKIDDSEIKSKALSMKVLIEEMREQTQNIE